MERPKLFNREGVLEKALPVFWRRGFADASLHELEVATGVPNAPTRRPYAIFVTISGEGFSETRNHCAQRLVSKFSAPHSPYNAVTAGFAPPRSM
jgi:hypothetical protein